MQHIAQAVSQSSTLALFIDDALAALYRSKPNEFGGGENAARDSCEQHSGSAVRGLPETSAFSGSPAETMRPYCTRPTYNPTWQATVCHNLCTLTMCRRPQPRTEEKSQEASDTGTNHHDTPHHSHPHPRRTTSVRRPRLELGCPGLPYPHCAHSTEPALALARSTQLALTPAREPQRARARIAQATTRAHHSARSRIARSTRAIAPATSAQNASSPRRRTSPASANDARGPGLRCVTYSPTPRFCARRTCGGRDQRRRQCGMRRHGRGEGSTALKCGAEGRRGGSEARGEGWT